MTTSNLDQMTGRFFADLAKRQKSLDSLLCVGLDPDLSRLPARYRSAADPILSFCKDVVDATHDLVGCFKPQFAHFAAANALPALSEIVAYCHEKNVPVILDAKRGDVGSTSSFYAREAFDVYGADAVTVNPYLGGDSLAPFLERSDKGVILLCRTSNPGGADLQNLKLSSGLEVYEQVAKMAVEQWNSNKNVGLVVGATRPDELKRVRAIVGEMTLLLPGIGAQGGDVAASLAAGAGGGLIVSSSRAVLYPKGGEMAGVRAEAEKTRLSLNEHRL
ncbi:MAG: orotidine-5'-phosphate decarboxylase [Pseudomonadales bacterium]